MGSKYEYFQCNFRFVVANATSKEFLAYHLFHLHFKHLNISQLPDLTASNSIDVPKISDTMFGDLKDKI